MLLKTAAEFTFTRRTTSLRPSIEADPAKRAVDRAEFMRLVGNLRQFQVCKCPALLLG